MILRPGTECPEQDTTLQSAALGGPSETDLRTGGWGRREVFNISGEARRGMCVEAQAHSSTGMCSMRARKISLRVMMPMSS